MALRTGLPRLLVLGVLVLVTPAALADGSDFDRLAPILEHYRQELGIPGMSAAVVRGQELVWAQGFGYADLENRTAATPDTPYHLASLTKTFTSQVILRLVEEGKLDLDAPVRDFGVKIPNDGGIRVRHLLTHTSEGPPGAFYNYSGYRFSFLAKVIEKASGRSFRDLVIEWILEPADMRDTAPALERSGFGRIVTRLTSGSPDTSFARVNASLARPYALDDSGNVVPNTYPQGFNPSSGLISTVADMAKYDRAIDHHAFISREFQELAFAPTIATNRDTLPYGLGWFTERFGDRRLLWHYGWEVSYSALILKVPEENVTFVVMANSDYLSRPFGLGRGDVLSSPFAIAFLRTIVLRERIGEDAPEIDWAARPEQIAAQVGTVHSPLLRELLRRELIANTMLYRAMRRTDVHDQLLAASRLAFTHEDLPEHAGIPRIVDLGPVGHDEYRTAPFALEEDAVVRLYALGEGGNNEMWDYGGIEDVATGQLIWLMHNMSADWAGGAFKNRRIDRLLRLPAGHYRAHYKTDDSHAFMQWNAIPPTHHWWGMRLLDVTDRQPARAQESWVKATAPENLGWSGAALEALVPEMERFGTHALMIVTDGRVVFEYGNIANNFLSHSMRKSLLSALYGIYVADGAIDTSLTLGGLGITENVPLTETELQARVADLLRARSGVYLPAAAETQSMRMARPPRGSHAPGTHWYYNNWDFNVLGTIFRQETGEDIYGAFAQRIAEPIGMEDFFVARQAYDHELGFSIHPSYPFRISARDAARFGQLVLQGGRWGDVQVIPEDWVDVSTSSYSDTRMPGTGYGFMWWVLAEETHGLPPGSYYASGYGGQKIFVIPALRSVVVHRINVQAPGIDIMTASVAPFTLIEQIVAAHTGERDPHAQAVSDTALAPVRRLLDEQERAPQPVSGPLHVYRILYGCCVGLFLSGVVVWPVLWIVRRVRRRRGRAQALANLAKLVAGLNGILCALYVYLVFVVFDAFEHFVQSGLPVGLEFPGSVLVRIPAISVVLTAIMLLLGVRAWVGRYWSAGERLHYVLITIAAIGFVIMSRQLELI